jgi:hypothetical protein
MANDYFGKKLEVGDLVAFSLRQSIGFIRGKIDSITKTDGNVYVLITFENGTIIRCDANVIKIIHGRWKLCKDGSGICDNCGRTSKNVWDYDNYQNYCGHCGAKMNL